MEKCCWNHFLFLLYLLGPMSRWEVWAISCFHQTGKRKRNSPSKFGKEEASITWPATGTRTRCKDCQLHLLDGATSFVRSSSHRPMHFTGYHFGVEPTVVTQVEYLRLACHRHCWANNVWWDFGSMFTSQVARLQEQLQTERDLRAALEIGLSMSAAQLSAAQSLDLKVWIFDQG